MYAIVDIAGQQFKVSKDQQLFVHRLEGKEGSKVDFDSVLLIDNNGKVNVGAPAINGARVSAKILEHLKDDKVLVFKKKRRKGYKKKNGHRQYMTKIQIEGIVEKGAKPAAKATESTPKAAEAAKPAAAKATATKAAPKAAAEKTATAKTTAAKKPAAKSSAAKTTASKTTAAKSTTSKATAKPATAKTAKKPAAAKKSDETAKKATPKKDTDKSAE